MIFKSIKLPNTNIEINSHGVWLRVSLNVSKEVSRFLTKGNLSKSKKSGIMMFTISAKINGQMNEDKLNVAYNTALKTAMICIRDAKIIILENEKLREIPNIQYKIF